MSLGGFTRRFMGTCGRDISSVTMVRNFSRVRITPLMSASRI